MKTIFFLFLSVIVSIPLSAQNKPEVTNVVVSQQTNGSAKVDIYYDVMDADGQTMTISVEASHDSGKTWTFPIQTVSGDIGTGIQSGTGKHIVWNFAQDHPDMTVQNVQIKVFADDNTTGGFLTYNGFTYTTVTIGNQEWTVENLRTTTYNDGTVIQNLIDDGTWTTTVDGAFCAYEKNESNVATYGYLYNWYAVNTGKLAPEGWRVPTDEDWSNLMSAVGGEDGAGFVLKSRSGWSDSGNGTDSFGFCAPPGGYRDYFNGSFINAGSYSYWWSTTPNGNDFTFHRIMYAIFDYVVRGSYGERKSGYSVRFVRDL